MAKQASQQVVEKPVRVLHLEDEAADAALVERELRTVGRAFALKRVDSKEAFSQALIDFAPDLILADYSLPSFDGVTALRIAREQCPETPFIFVSGTIGEDVAIESLKAGATDYILKHRLARLVPSVRRTLEEVNERLERRRAQEQLQAAQHQLIQAEKMESIGRLAAGVAHEVKNPLSVILMGVDCLLGRLASDKDRTILSHIAESAKRADTVIRGLLDFSASRAEDLKPEDLNRIVEQALLLVKHELVRSHVTVVKDLSPEVPPLQLERTKIEQVFINLFMNAIDAMSEGGTLTVRTAVKVLDAVGPHVGRRTTDRFRIGDTVAVVEIDDTGIGIPAEHLSKLLDPFFTTKPPGKGTGLGLSVAKSLVESHGGTIDIRNRPEGGVRVTLMFPVQRR